MDKNFNSFHQMLEGLGQKSFRSFKDWAQNMNGVPESQEKRQKFLKIVIEVNGLQKEIKKKLQEPTPEQIAAANKPSSAVS